MDKKIEEVLDMCESVLSTCEKLKNSSSRGAVIYGLSVFEKIEDMYAYIYQNRKYSGEQLYTIQNMKKGAEHWLEALSIELDNGEFEFTPNTGDIPL